TKEGYDFAVEKINAAGGVKVGDESYKLEAKDYGDQSESARATQLDERLGNQDGAKVILSPYGSPLTAAMAPVNAERHARRVCGRVLVPMLEPNGAARSL